LVIAFGLYNIYTLLLILLFSAIKNETFFEIYYTGTKLDKWKNISLQNEFEIKDKISNLSNAN